jgi:hypothetical protein
MILALVSFCVSLLPVTIVCWPERIIWCLVTVVRAVKCVSKWDCVYNWLDGRGIHNVSGNQSGLEIIMLNASNVGIGGSKGRGERLVL